MRRLVCIDPGLATVAIAVFLIAPVGSFLPGEGMAHLEGVTQIVTDPKKPIGERLRAIRKGVKDLTDLIARKDGEPVVLIEEPAIAGTYNERAGRQRGKQGINAAAMAVYNQAYGVTLEALSYREVVRIRAGLKKERKREIVDQALRDFPPSAAVLASFPTRRKLSQHEVDCLAIGISWDGWVPKE